MTRYHEGYNYVLGRGLYFTFYPPKGLRGKENKNLLTQYVQKLEQNDQNVFIFTLLQIYVR